MELPVVVKDTNRIPEILESMPVYVEMAFRRVMQRVHWWIQEVFRMQGPEDVLDPVNHDIYSRWLDISEETARRKGSNVILIDTGVMRNSIQITDIVREEGRLVGRIGIFVGPALRYARIHEFGGTIRMTVTERQRKFFLALFLEEKREDPDKPFEEYEHKPLRATTRDIVIWMPQRSFLRTGMIRATDDAMALFVAILGAVLDGTLK